jgi:hypothetical protein
VHLILDVVVALVFLFFLLVDFGFDIDEHVALGLLPALRGPCHNVVLVLFIVIVVLIFVIFVLFCAFFVILVIVVASLGYIVLIVLVCGSWPAHRCAGSRYVIFVDFGHRVEWLIIRARVAVVVARHGAVDAGVGGESGARECKKAGAGAGAGSSLKGSGTGVTRGVLASACVVCALGERGGGVIK